MKKILIVGAGGFIGFNLSNFFLKKKYKIIGIDNLSREGSKNKINFLKSNFRNFNFYKCDITDYKKLKNIISKLNNLKSIIHTAGQVTVTESINDPIQDFKINSMGTLYLLELTKKYHRSTKFIFSSTNKVYGNLNELKILKRKNNYLLRNYHYGVNEELNVDFCSPYGCSKGSADQYVKDFGRIFNMNTVVLRKSCIYGHEQLGIFGQGWISFIMIQAIMGNKITIFGDGYQTRDILYIDDLVELYNKIINKNYKGYEFYNVGGGKQNLLSVKDLILFLKKRNLIKKKIKYAPERLGDQKTYYSNISKVSKKYNWKPKVFKDSGLKKILNYFSNNIDLLEKIYK